jgi:hypothetical protein
MRKHGFVLFQDMVGMWCAAPPGFRDLMHDPSGWGKTRDEAVQRLLARADYQERAFTAGWNPRLRDFTIVPPPLENLDALEQDGLRVAARDAPRLHPVR